MFYGVGFTPCFAPCYSYGFSPFTGYMGGLYDCCGSVTGAAMMGGPYMGAHAGAAKGGFLGAGVGTLVGAGIGSIFGPVGTVGGALLGGLFGGGVGASAGAGYGWDVGMASRGMWW